MRISDWSSDVCSSDLEYHARQLSSDGRSADARRTHGLLRRHRNNRRAHRGAAPHPRRFHRAALRGRSARMSLFASVIALTLAGTAPAADYRQRPPEDEIVYFLLPDRVANGDAGNARGGLEGTRAEIGRDGGQERRGQA